MAKSNSKATIMVGDGRGGMVQVQDRRFEAARDWPIQFEVPAGQSETWLEYFSAECARRGWSCNGMRQIEARENSGSVNVNRCLRTVVRALHKSAFAAKLPLVRALFSSAFKTRGQRRANQASHRQRCDSRGNIRRCCDGRLRPREARLRGALFQN